MIKVITYGTFDVFHQGHYNLLKNAKALGDYLVVGVTTENYDKERGKLNVSQSLMERIKNVKDSGLADEIIIEEYEGQKIEDIQKYNIDIFAIGSDWIGKFDYLSEYCTVNYLQRTKGVSSTMIRNSKDIVIKLGVIGTGRIANRFIVESKYVSGVNIEAVFNPKIESAKEFSVKHELNYYSDDFNMFIEKVDAVYIASPHLTHDEYIERALQKGKHVLCEKPMVLNSEKATQLYDLAKNKKLILLEAVKTAYCPGFRRLVTIVKSGAIGTIKNIDASFTKLTPSDTREMIKSMAGGSMTELGSYPLFAILKILGTNCKEVNFVSYNNSQVDVFTKGQILYEKAVATFKVGLGVKTEGDLIISGTKGYAYVPAPWWKTEYFELRYEDLNATKKYFYKFEGDGLRYELTEFLQRIKSNENSSFLLTVEESLEIARIMQLYLQNVNVTTID